MLLKPKVSFAFKCPNCGSAKTHTFDAFKLSAGSHICACTCTRSCMHLLFGDGFATIEFVCPYCGVIHSYRLSVSELLHGNLNELVCCETELVCAYAGDPTRVEQEIRGYNTSIDSLASKLSELDDDELAGAERDEIDAALVKSGESGKLKDANLVLSSLCAAEDMLYSGMIKCTCGSKKFELAFLGGHIQVKCSECGAYIRISARSDEDLKKMREMGYVILTK